MSSLASRTVLLVLLSLACAHAMQYHPVGPSSNPAQVSSSQISKITDLVNDIRKRWEKLDASCDSRAVFALTYAYMTEGIAQFIQNNYFDDGNSMVDFVVELSSMYTSAFDSWAEADVAQVPSSWAEAFSWTVYGESNTTEDLLLGMNAHMTYDLAVTAFKTKYYEPSKKADYNRVNDQIIAVLYNVSIALAERYDAHLEPNTLEGGITNFLMPKIISWRADALKSAIMFSIAQTDRQMRVFAKGCENAATLTAYTFQLVKPAPTAEARLAYCQENQPQAKARKLAASFAAAAAAQAAPAPAREEEAVAAPPDMSAKGLPDVQVTGGFTSLLGALKL